VPGFLYYARAAADAGLPGTIWVRSGDGLVDHLVTSGGRPTLSSDGRFMGFLRDGTNGAVEGSRGDLWVRDLATGAELKLFTNDDYVVFGSFVPDSGVLVFDYLCQLAQVPVDGGLTAAFPGFGGCYTDMPAVSPSGRRVAIRNLQSGLGMEDFDGQNARWILPAVAGHTASYPRWAPNEERLSYIFGPLDDGRGEARSIQPDGGGDAPLSITDVCGAPLVLSGPAVWTADGRWAVAAGVGQGVSALWAMAADGGGEVMRLCVADGPPVIFSGGQALAWPDGGAR
jgi:hypothetical protein